VGLPLHRLDPAKLPVVSVIIPVHNEELVIERRLDNILRNGYPKNKMQIVVVDSGSADKTSSIVREKKTKLGSCEKNIDQQSHKNPE
jgi:glycosyltransferase involved in cell wall biosynthesis